MNCDLYLACWLFFFKFRNRFHTKEIYFWILLLTGTFSPGMAPLAVLDEYTTLSIPSASCLACRNFSIVRLYEWSTLKLIKFRRHYGQFTTNILCTESIWLFLLFVLWFVLFVMRVCSFICSLFRGGASIPEHLHSGCRLQQSCVTWSTRHFPLQITDSLEIIFGYLGLLHVKHVLWLHVSFMLDRWSRFSQHRRVRILVQQNVNF